MEGGNRCTQRNPPTLRTGVTRIIPKRDINSERLTAAVAGKCSDHSTTTCSDTWMIGGAFYLMTHHLCRITAGHQAALDLSNRLPSSPPRPTLMRKFYYPHFSPIAHFVTFTTTTTTTNTIIPTPHLSALPENILVFLSHSLPASALLSLLPLSFLCFCDQRASGPRLYLS